MRDWTIVLAGAVGGALIAVAVIFSAASSGLLPHGNADGGVVFGGNAAMIAAEVIRDHLREGESLGRYGRLFRKNFGKEIILHRMISKVYASLDVKSIERLIKISKTFGLEGFFSEHGDMDRPSVMLKRFIFRGFVK